MSSTDYRYVFSTETVMTKAGGNYPETALFFKSLTFKKRVEWCWVLTHRCIIEPAVPLPTQLQQTTDIYTVRIELKHLQRLLLESFKW